MGGRKPKTANNKHVVSNPYNPPKILRPNYSYCEECDREMPTKDINGHNSSKGHRANAEIYQNNIIAQKKAAKEANQRSDDIATWAQDVKPGANANESATTASEWVDGNNAHEPLGTAWDGGDGNEPGAGTIDESSGWDGGNTGSNSNNYVSNDGFTSAVHKNARTGGNGGYSGRAYGGKGNNGGDGSNVCFRCHQSGHFARECPNVNDAVPRNNSGGCYNCGGDHIKRDCPEGLKSAGVGVGGCFTCGGDHLKRDCPTRPSGGGGRECYNCGQPDHISRDCPQPRNRDGRGPKCFACSEFGHKSDNCPKNSTGNDAETADHLENFDSTPTEAVHGDWANGTNAEEKRLDAWNDEDPQWNVGAGCLYQTNNAPVIGASTLASSSKSHTQHSTRLKDDPLRERSPTRRRRRRARRYRFNRKPPRDLIVPRTSGWRD